MLKRFTKEYPSRRLCAKKDRELMVRFKEGELECFEIIYSRFYKPLSRYVAKSVQNSSISEELTQEIFLKIYQNRLSYNPEYQVTTWIWTIAKNTIYDHLRQTRNDVTQTLLQSQPQEWECTSLITAESIMIAESEKNQLIDRMELLSSKQKEAIFLRLVKKLSYKQISQVMNLSLSAVKSLINRGKSALTKNPVEKLFPENS